MPIDVVLNHYISFEIYHFRVPQLLHKTRLICPCSVVPLPGVYLSAAHARQKNSSVQIDAGSWVELRNDKLDTAGGKTVLFLWISWIPGISPNDLPTVSAQSGLSHKFTWLQLLLRSSKILYMAKATYSFNPLDDPVSTLHIHEIWWW